MESVKEELFGKDAKALKALTFARNVAVTKAPVLITGEVGVGKRSLAKYIHSSSNRSNEKITLVDCCAPPPEVENKILGYRDEKSGRFIKGVLEQTNGGTVVLFNIDGMIESFQKRLFQIFNELVDYDIDVRVISITTKNLSKLVGAGKFYRALYTYLSNAQIVMVPLRERMGDIQFLSAEILSAICMESSIACPAVEDDVDKRLLSHYWTHNISELISVIKETFDNSNKEVITLNDLALGDRKVIHGIGNDNDGVKLMSLKDAEKLLIRKALVHTSENRTQAAKILGVSIRTLRNKINEYRTEGSQFFLNLR